MASILLQSLPFVHPSIAGIALATGLIPIVIHLINRRRYRREPWAAMLFLLAARRRSARRIRLQHLLLLMVRGLAIVLLGLAIARPYVPSVGLLPTGSARCHRVVLLDNSLSMGARTEGQETRFDVAHRCAENLLSSFARTDAVSLVTLAEPAQALIDYPAYDRRMIRERLASIGPTQRVSDIEGATAKTLEILAASEVAAGNRAVYLISDFPRRTWIGESATLAAQATGPATPAVTAARQLADALGDSQVDLTMFQVPANLTDNVAVTRIEVDSRLVTVDRPVRLTAEVGNFGSSGARGLVLQVRRNGDIVRRLTLPAIEPGNTVTTTLSLEFPTPGTHAVEARVIHPTGDSLKDDDARYLSVEARETTSVLVVDGRPGPTPLSGEAGFFATALAPTLRLDDRRAVPGSLRRSAAVPITPKTITTAELETEVLSEYDVVALCNVPRLAAEQWTELGEFVSSGRGLFVLAGDLISFDNYNRFGHADGGGLLSVHLQRSGPGMADSGGSVDFVLDPTPHPLVADFAARPDCGLFLARVDDYLPVEFDDHQVEVVIRYSDGGPALLASAWGRGRVLFYTTTADMDWNNLPAKGDYVSLMVSAVTYLAPRHGGDRNVMIGQVLTEPLTPAQSSMPLHVITPAGATTEGRLVSIGEALAFEYGPVERAGAITLSVGHEVRTFAANVDPIESDLHGASDRDLAATLERPVRLVSATTALAETIEQAGARSTELARVALYIVMALLLAESCLAMVFGPRSESKTPGPIGIAGPRGATAQSGGLP